MQIENEKQYNQIREKYEIYRRKAFQKELNINGIFEYFDLRELIKDYDSRNNRLQNKKTTKPKI